MRAEPRDPATRKGDTLAMLATPAIDVWVATASPDGAPYLVPVSLAWVDERAVIAIPAGSVTARNLRATGAARLGVGPTRDVVMLDVALEEELPVGGAGAAATGELFAAQADWDPREDSGYVFLVLRPTRVQAWREANEIAGRTLMREGSWVC